MHTRYVAQPTMSSLAIPHAKETLFKNHAGNNSLSMQLFLNIVHFHEKVILNTSCIGTSFEMEKSTKFLFSPTTKFKTQNLN